MNVPLCRLLPALTATSMLLMAGCGGNGAMPPAVPSPTPMPVTASAYVLPNAVSLGDSAFGDEPVVIYKGERQRFVDVSSPTNPAQLDNN